MSVLRKIRSFARSEDGAVTVDWVVLTAAVIALMLTAMAGLQGNMTTVGQKAGDFLSTRTINTSFD